jgi:hypothetical protein
MHFWLYRLVNNLLDKSDARMYSIFSKTHANSLTWLDRKMREKNGKRYGVLNIGAPYGRSGKWIKDNAAAESDSTGDLRRRNRSSPS